jgi:hypothetical protein
MIKRPATAVPPTRDSGKAWRGFRGLVFTSCTPSSCSCQHLGDGSTTSGAHITRWVVIIQHSLRPAPDSKHNEQLLRPRYRVFMIIMVDSMAVLQSLNCLSSIFTLPVSSPLVNKERHKNDRGPLENFAVQHTYQTFLVIDVMNSELMTNL